jgi:hypothetical protein
LLVADAESLGARSSGNRVKLLLTQLPKRLDDGASNFGAVARMLDRSPAIMAAAGRTRRW